MGAPVPAAAANIPQADGSSLMTALSEQLGLKLESARAPVDVVVIDSVEAPTPDSRRTSRGWPHCSVRAIVDADQE
jgi:hypothetical protein